MKGKHALATVFYTFIENKESTHTNEKDVC
jgi:hypothetical protein